MRTNITSESTAINSCNAPVLNCLRRGNFSVLHSELTQFVRTALIDFDCNTIVPARNGKFSTINREFSQYTNRSDCASRIGTCIAN